VLIISTPEEIVSKLENVLVCEKLSPSAKVLLSHLILKNKSFKFTFSYRQVNKELGIALRTITGAVDNLRVIDFMEVYSESKNGTFIDCSRCFLENSTVLKSSTPHDNKYFNLLKEKYNNIMGVAKISTVTPMLAVFYNLTKKDFSPSVLEKLSQLDDNAISFVFAYTVIRLPNPGNARAGYIFKTIDQKYYKALDILAMQKATERVDVANILMKTKIEDLGRQELIKYASVFEKVFSVASETEEIRSFIVKKISQANELKKMLLEVSSV